MDTNSGMDDVGKIVGHLTKQEVMGVIPPNTIARQEFGNWCMLRLAIECQPDNVKNVIHAAAIMKHIAQDIHHELKRKQRTKDAQLRRCWDINPQTTTTITCINAYYVML
jgi:hypothetical protein